MEAFVSAAQQRRTDEYAFTLSKSADRIGLPSKNSWHGLTLLLTKMRMMPFFIRWKAATKELFERHLPLAESLSHCDRISSDHVDNSSDTAEIFATAIRVAQGCLTAQLIRSNRWGWIYRPRRPNRLRIVPLPSQYPALISLRFCDSLGMLPLFMRPEHRYTDSPLTSTPQCASHTGCNS